MLAVPPPALIWASMRDRRVPDDADKLALISASTQTLAQISATPHQLSNAGEPSDGPLRSRVQLSLTISWHRQLIIGEDEYHVQTYHEPSTISENCFR